MRAVFLVYRNRKRRRLGDIFYLFPSFVMAPNTDLPFRYGTPISVFPPARNKSTLSKAILSPALLFPGSFSILISLPAETIYCFPPVSITAKSFIIEIFYTYFKKTQAMLRIFRFRSPHILHTVYSSFRRPPYTTYCILYTRLHVLLRLVQNQRLNPRPRSCNLQNIFIYLFE